MARRPRRAVMEGNPRLLMVLLLLLLLVEQEQCRGKTVPLLQA
jgi:hypothetical protein